MARAQVGNDDTETAQPDRLDGNSVAIPIRRMRRLLGELTNYGRNEEDLKGPRKRIGFVAGRVAHPIWRSCG